MISKSAKFSELAMMLVEKLQLPDLCSKEMVKQIPAAF